MHDFTPIEWIGNAAEGYLRLLDQTQLPDPVVYIDCRDIESVWDAIKRLCVRGAPAIGAAAAFGCVIGAQNNDFEAAADYLATSRPTAVNLFWAIERMKKVTPRTPEAMLAEAKRIHAEEMDRSRRIGEHGARFIESLPEGRRGVITHCNAGACMGGGLGTATAPMYVAHERGVPFKVFADETRPLLQGARITAFELASAGVDVTVICDNMAAQVMREGRVGMVITGADRIAANGDAANKIGTYSLAIAARHHGIPFYVAAPTSTIDLATLTGADIPIEQRDGREIAEGFGRRTAPRDVPTYNPAFDVTPAELITAIITEHGVIQPVNADTVRAGVNV